MRQRRGPWLSGLIAAALGIAWMVGQVIAGAVSMALDTLGGLPAAPPAAPAPAWTGEPWPIHP